MIEAGRIEVDSGALEKATLSQWQLIRIRFARHLLAHISLFLILVLYLVAAFAEFFAPYPKTWKHLSFSYCPPQFPAFDLANGIHVAALEQETDRVTLRKFYRTDMARLTSLGFFVRGEPYRLWGLIPMERHFFGARRTADPGNAQTPAPYYLLGADRYGRDIFSRLIYGSRISLSIGLFSIAITFFLGITIGGISGYLGGRTDLVIQRFIEIVNSFPHLPLWLALGAVVPGEWSALRVYFAITVVLSLLNWTGLARVVRGKILSLREEDYAVAARLIGAGHGRVLFRHLLPGFTSHIIVSLTLSVPAMILGETTLSFLGLGLRPPIVSWGVLLQDCLNLEVVASYPWHLMPVVMIIVTVLAFNFLGDGLRDAADPYSAR